MKKGTQTTGAKAGMTQASARTSGFPPRQAPEGAGSEAARSYSARTSSATRRRVFPHCSSVMTPARISESESRRIGSRPVMRSSSSAGRYARWSSELVWESSRSRSHQSTQGPPLCRTPLMILFPSRNRASASRPLISRTISAFSMPRVRGLNLWVGVLMP